MTLEEYALAKGRPELLSQWDGAGNGGLAPDGVSAGSGLRAWWRCGQGHRWQARVSARAAMGRGCPFCAGKRLLPGENDLASRFPEVAAEWHPTKNGSLTPETVTCGADRRVWWRCGRGHEWPAKVYARTSGGTGCPYCAGQLPIPGETDLASRFPEAAALWHPTKNGGVTPEQVMPGSHRSCWWRCGRGHEWKAQVQSVTGGTGCPYCAGKLPIPGETDFATRFPEAAAEWHPTKNGALTPDALAFGSRRRVWWRCGLGHDYQARLSSRAAGTGCPYCAGRRVWPGFNDLASAAPALAAEWHPALNGGLTPEQVTRCSKRKVWWQCREGHVWKTAVYARTRERAAGCPVCAGTVRQSARRAG